MRERLIALGSDAREGIACGSTWNAMVLGHVKYRQGQKALELFQQMQQEGV